MENKFFGNIVCGETANMQVNVCGRCISISGNTSCLNDGKLRRFSLVVFADTTRKSAVTFQAITDKRQWQDEDVGYADATAENFVTAYTWCLKNPAEDYVPE